MNFYKHHLGDYDGHTAHLSWDEDMAYTRLLRAYYRRERGIPDAEKYRLARAATAGQRRAVDSVLSEFFTLEGNDWRQKRCDEEIEAYQAQRDHNREVGKLGGRPRKTQVVLQENQTETKVVPENNPNQNHKPEPDKRRGKPPSRETPLPADFGISDRVRAWAIDRGYLNLDAHFEHFVGVAKAKGYAYVDWDHAFMNAVRKDWAGIGKGSDNRPRLAQ